MSVKCIKCFNVIKSNGIYIETGKQNHNGINCNKFYEYFITYVLDITLRILSETLQMQTEYKDGKWRLIWI